MSGVSGAMMQAGAGLALSGVVLSRAWDFVSSDQTITDGATVSVAHGLGAAPSVFEAVPVCQTGENGYSAGDEMEPNPDANSSNAGYSVSADASNIYITVGVVKLNKRSATIGNVSSITNGNWRFRARASL